MNIFLLNFITTIKTVLVSIIAHSKKMEENLANTYQRLPADTTDAPRHIVTAEQEGQAHYPLPTQTYTGGKTKRG